MNLYFVKDWQRHFETNETRKLAKLRWWPKPNKHDGLGFRKMASEKDRCQLYAAWNLILDLASKTTPASRRGYLERDGVPLSPEDMGLSAGFPAEVFERALAFFTSPEMKWLCVEYAGSPGDVPADAGNVPAVLKEEKEEKEENRTYSPDSRIALFWLNEKTGKRFRETETSLAPIAARLKEEGVDIDGVKKMIERQCNLWRGTKMQDYLTPTTLFGKEKFSNYYANRDQPIILTDRQNNPEFKRSGGNSASCIAPGPTGRCI